MDKKYLISFLVTVKGGKVAMTQIRSIEKQIDKTGKTTKRATGMTGQFIKALKRVAIVVPVWFAFRQAMMAVFNTISQGVRYWVELESAIARASAVTSGAPEGMARAMEELRGLAETFARTHAGTSKEVIEAYYRMGTSGLTFRDAIMATIPAVTLAKGTYGDVAMTAKTVSAMYRLLGDNIEGVTTKQEKMRKIADVLARAWSDHEIEMNELAQAIANVGGQAKAFGLSMTELVAVLAVSHDALLKGGRSGRLFGRSLDELAQKLPAVEKELGKAFDPKRALDWFDILKELIDTFRKMGKTTPEIEKRLSKIFNIRSKRIIRAMVAMGERFNETLVDLQKNSKGMADALLEIRDNTPEVQLENMRDNFNMLIKDFVIGITRTDDFVEALKDVNKWLERMSLNATIAGAQLGEVGKGIKAVWRGLLAMTPKTKGEQIIESLFPFAALPKMMKRYQDELKKQGLETVVGAGAKAGEEWFDRRRARLEELEKQREEELKELEAQMNAEYEIDEAIKMRLQLQEDLINYRKLEILGYDEMQISQQKLLDYVDAVTESLKNQGIEVNKQKLLIAVLKQDWAEVLRITQAHVITEKELVNVAKMMNQVQLEQLNIRQRQREAIRGLYTSFAQADKYERNKLRRVMELMKLTPEQLAGRYRRDIEDRTLIDQYFSHFSKKGQEAVNDIRKSLWRLPDIEIFDESFPKTANEFWKVWTEGIPPALEDFRKQWRDIVSELKRADRGEATPILGADETKSKVEEHMRIWRQSFKDLGTEWTTELEGRMREIFTQMFSDATAQGIEEGSKRAIVTGGYGETWEETRIDWREVQRKRRARELGGAVMGELYSELFPSQALIPPEKLTAENIAEGVRRGMIEAERTRERRIEISIGDMTFTAEGETAEEIADSIGKQIKQKLLEDQRFQKRFADQTRKFM